MQETSDMQKEALNRHLVRHICRLMKFSQIENINLNNGIRLTEVTALSDSYTAANKQIAGYLSTRIPIGEKINIYAGLRS